MFFFSYLLWLLILISQVMGGNAQKYPCLFTNVDTLAGKTIATSVLQYHIIPGKALSYQQMKNLAINMDYVSATAFTGHKLNITKGGIKLNGYSTVSDPDISTKLSQSIQGITTLLVPPGLIVSNYSSKLNYLP